MSFLSDCLQNTKCTGGTGDILSDECRESVFNYCTGIPPPGEEIDAFWTRWMPFFYGVEGSCSNVVKDWLYTFDDFNTCYNPIKTGNNACGMRYDGEDNLINSEVWAFSQSIIDGAVTRYLNDGYDLGAVPGQYGYTPFNESIYDVCCSYPGLCEGTLDKYCDRFSIQDLQSNQTLRNLCGCHLSSIQYQQYSKNYNIEQQCNPICNNVQSIGISGTGGNPIPCEQNVCIIDNTSVDFLNSTASSISFRQICGYCEPGKCSCVIDNSVVEIINTEIGGKLIPILNECGTIDCNILDEDSGDSIPCGTETISSLKQKLDQEKETIKSRSIIITSIILLLIILSAIGIWYLLNKI